MKQLYDPDRVAEVKARLATLRPDSPRQWGTMSAPQMVAHLSVAVESTLGDRPVKRGFLGRLIGGIIKRRVLSNDEPFMKNSPTAPELIIDGERDLDHERQKLIGLIDRFVTGGPSACTTQPHPFFGKMTPDEWAILMYKHLDHHLRQFGV